MNIDFASDLYQYYLKTQITDTLGEEPAPIYTKFIKEKLLPDYDWGGKRVLDVGARMFLTYDLFRDLGAAEVVGIDIGAAGLKAAHSEGRPCLELDAHRMLEKFEPESFDFVYSTHALEHMISVSTVLKNIYTVLKPGGYFFCAVPSPCGVDPDPMKREGHWTAIESDGQFESWVMEAGFTADTRVFAEHMSGKLRQADEYITLRRKLG